MMVRFRKTQALIMAIITFILTVTLYSSVEVNAVNTSQTYTIFNASGAYVDEYTLASNPVKDNSREIIGEDERYSDNTLSGVVKIYTNYIIGTGFFIDEHTIATAAHVVFNKTSGNYTNSQVQISEINVYNENGTVAKKFEVHIMFIYPITT
jgi:V8-like Glu-specific endopeptidase